MLAALVLGTIGPALAHQDHKKQIEAARVTPPSSSQHAASGAMSDDPTAMCAQMGEMMGDKSADGAKMTCFERVIDWLGRLHPMIVHFPIALSPAALFTAIVGRRKPALGKPVEFLVVAGGILARAGISPGEVPGGIAKTLSWLFAIIL